MLLCPDCHDSQWKVVGSLDGQFARCHGYKAQVNDSNRIELKLCGLTFTLPSGVVLFSTASLMEDVENLKQL